MPLLLVVGWGGGKGGTGGGLDEEEPLLVLVRGRAMNHFLRMGKMVDGGGKRLRKVGDDENGGLQNQTASLANELARCGLTLQSGSHTYIQAEGLGTSFLYTHTNISHTNDQW